MEMTRIAVKQPDGKWALWSTVVDDFLIDDATREDIIEYELEKERNEIERWLDDVEDPDIGYRPSKSYKELVELKKHLDENNDG